MDKEQQQAMSAGEYALNKILAQYAASVSALAEIVRAEMQQPKGTRHEQAHSNDNDRAGNGGDGGGVSD